jgi:hypothetical protein
LVHKGHKVILVTPVQLAQLQGHWGTQAVQVLDTLAVGELMGILDPWVLMGILDLLAHKDLLVILDLLDILGQRVQF